MMVKPPTRIGSKEYVGFPAASIDKVPAKIDTGADSSAIWATDIKEGRDGSLSFKLFGPGSRYYTGETLVAEHFKISQVTSSFGHKEERYKVKLPAVICGRKINVEFNLADRSRNRYPVLIGRRTLNKRFIVDVSKDNTLPGDVSRRVLILNSQPSHSVEGLVRSMNANTPGLKADFYTYDDLVIQMSGSGINITNIQTERPLSEYDLIYFKTYFKAAEMAAAVAEYALLHGINFIDSEVATYHAYTKLSQYARLARFGLPVPKSLAVSYKLLPEQFERFATSLGVPFVLKDAGADKGESNYLIKTEADFKKVSEKAVANKACYIGQEYIANDGDYRIVVLDKEVKLVIERRRQDDTTHMNNTSQGAHARLLEANEMPSGVNALAVRAALAMGREVAGVDLMRNQANGDWVILEVNNSPQLASGAYTDRKARELGSFLLHFAEK